MKMNHNPRFSVEECPECSNDRKFMNNKCVYNKRLGMAYSVTEIVEVLNNRHYQDRVYELLQNKIWYMQGMYHRTGDEKYKQEEVILKELREELYEPYHSSVKYTEKLKEWFLEEKGKEKK
ncbi:MAG: hypothetical protein IJH63_10445 [Methanobrevibacter sp.]|nr:hypothetical protein [Methanosphaera sp.]MBR0371119.1 hypothetical protein [Methanobrevibacter sp.]